MVILGWYTIYLGVTTPPIFWYLYDFIVVYQSNMMMNNTSYLYCASRYYFKSTITQKSELVLAIFLRLILKNLYQQYAWIFSHLCKDERLKTITYNCEPIMNSWSMYDSRHHNLFHALRDMYLMYWWKIYNDVL